MCPGSYLLDNQAAETMRDEYDWTASVFLGPEPRPPYVLQEIFRVGVDARLAGGFPHMDDARIIAPSYYANIGQVSFK